MRRKATGEEERKISTMDDMSKMGQTSAISTYIQKVELERT
jgi:hypothetical protein